MNWEIPSVINSTRGSQHRIVGNCRFRYAYTFQNGDQSYRCAQSKQCSARVRFGVNGEQLTNIDDIVHNGHAIPCMGTILAKVRQNEMKVRLPFSCIFMQ